VVRFRPFQAEVAASQEAVASEVLVAEASVEVALAEVGNLRYATNCQETTTGR